MSEGNAAGRKAEGTLIIRMYESVCEIADGMSGALMRAEQDTKYDDAGRLRDRELAHAAKLANANAQLLRAFLKLRAADEKR